MQPPLTSLSWIDWAVWADFAADYRPKAEPFARKVVRSLRKMEAVGCEPKMCLIFLMKGTTDTWVISDDEMTLPMKIDGNMNIDCRRVKWRSAKWVQRKWPHCTKLALSPADLPTHWQQTRLVWKFWKCVNRRALGIKDSVLEGLC